MLAALSTIIKLPKEINRSNGKELARDVKAFSKTLNVLHSSDHHHPKTEKITTKAMQVQTGLAAFTFSKCPAGLQQKCFDLGLKIHSLNWENASELMPEIELEIMTIFDTYPDATEVLAQAHLLEQIVPMGFTPCSDV